jgi:hypothetical protein
MEVLKKIRKAGKMNGFATELAEAQAEDFMAFRREFKEFASSVKEWQIKQGAQMELVVKYINSPAEQERKDGIVWHEIKAALKSWKGWTIIVLFIAALIAAGDKLWQMVGDKIQIG